MSRIVVYIIKIAIGAIVGMTFGTLLGPLIAEHFFLEMRVAGFMGWEGGGVLGGLCGMALGALVGAFAGRHASRFHHPESTLQ